MELLFLGLAIFLLTVGIVQSSSSLFTRYIKWRNELGGVETEITPVTFVGSRLIGGAYLIFGAIFLILFFLSLKSL